MSNSPINSRRITAAVTLALGCAALGSAVPASAASGGNDGGTNPSRAAVGASVQKSEGCSTNPDGTQTCYKSLTHDIEVLPANGMISQSYGQNLREVSPTGTSTSHWSSHSVWDGGWKEAHSQLVYTDENGCKTISRSRYVDGEPTYYSRTNCP